MLTTWQNGLEAFAVAAGLVYVVLAIREQRSCWIAGLLSTLAYGVLCEAEGLRLQGALQVVYAALAVVGWWQWRQQPTSSAETDAAGSGVSEAASTPAAMNALPAVRRLSAWGTAALLALTLMLTLLGHGLLASSGSTQPWLEAATTAGGLAATWLATRKFLDNWSWWAVINVATAWLFWQAALRPTAGLYIAYAALAVLGWREWRKQLA